MEHSRELYLGLSPRVTVSRAGASSTLARSIGTKNTITQTKIAPAPLGVRISKGHPTSLFPALDGACTRNKFEQIRRFKESG